MRHLEYKDFDEDSLIAFMCDQYAHKNDEDIELELEENAKFNKKLDDAKDKDTERKPTTYTCNKDYLDEKLDGDFSSVMPANAKKDSHTQKLLLFTFVFQSFVMMQVFNQFNARKLAHNEFNVFAGIFRNGLFLGITFLTILMQVAMVQWGGHIMKTQSLNF